MYLSSSDACNAVAGALQVAPSSLVAPGASSGAVAAALPSSSAGQPAGAAAPTSSPVPPSVAMGQRRKAMVDALAQRAQDAFCALNSRAPVSFTSLGPAVVADVNTTNQYAAGQWRCGVPEPGSPPGNGASPSGSSCALDTSDAPVVDSLESGLPYAAQPPQLTTSQPIDLPPGAGLGGYRRGGLAGLRGARAMRGLRGTGFPDWGNAYSPDGENRLIQSNTLQDAVQNIVSWVTANPAVSGLLALGLVAAVASMNGARRG